MKPGDLVKYESWHTARQNLTGLVIEVSRSYNRDGDLRARVLWSPRRLFLWDWVEELVVVSKSHREKVLENT